jgi:hypothetical protein
MATRHFHLTSLYLCLRMTGSQELTAGPSKAFEGHDACQTRQRLVLRDIPGDATRGRRSDLRYVVDGSP